MRTTFFVLTLTFGLVAHGTKGAGDHQPEMSAMSPPAHASCPAGSERAYSMVENFLTNPNLSDARIETGSSGLSPGQIQLVQEDSVCQQLMDDYNSQDLSGYNLSFYSAGSRYFAVLTIDQPDDSSEVISGLSMIDIYNENFNFIKGYSG